LCIAMAEADNPAVPPKYSADIPNIISFRDGKPPIHVTDAGKGLINRRRAQEMGSVLAPQPAPREQQSMTTDGHSYYDDPPAPPAYNDHPHGYAPQYGPPMQQQYHPQMNYQQQPPQQYVQQPPQQYVPQMPQAPVQPVVQTPTVQAPVKSIAEQAEELKHPPSESSEWSWKTLVVSLAVGVVGVVIGRGFKVSQELGGISPFR